MKGIKKIVSVLLTLAMVVGMFMGSSTTAEAASVRFQRNVYYVYSYDDVFKEDKDKNVTQLITASDIKTYKISHIDYAFLQVNSNGYIVSNSNSKNKSGSYLNISDSDDKVLKTLVGLKKNNPKLKVMVSLFGGDNTQAELVRNNIGNSDFRRHIAKAVKELMNTYGIDGVDLDWESPKSSSDAKNYLLLCQEIRSRAGAKGSGTLLTIATGIDSDAVNAYKTNSLVRDFNNVLDFWNLMTYDLTGSSNIGFTSPMVQHSGSNKYGFSSFQEGIKMYHDIGVAYTDMNVGIPFYGRKFYNISTKSSSVQWYAKCSSKSEAVTYSQVAGDYLNRSNWTKGWESNAQVNYLYKKDSSGYVTEVITYDDAVSIGYKLKYAQSLGISGVMTWRYGGDDSNNTLKKRIAEFVRSEVVQ